MVTASRSYVRITIHMRFKMYDSRVALAECIFKTSMSPNSSDDGSPHIEIRANRLNALKIFRFNESSFWQKFFRGEGRDAVE